MEEIRIKMTPAFEKLSHKLILPEILNDLLNTLESNPTKGTIIPGTGGIRKLRWITGKNNKGKSGGVRVLYHYSKNILILLITLYGKNQKDNISQSEKNELKRTIPQLVAKYMEDIE